MAVSYQQAGVNLEAGYEVVSRIKKHVSSTSRLGVMGNIGAFGGMFDLSALKLKEPILVSGTDGVGTKLKIAFALNRHDTIGIDAVAMCVNDVLAQGAEPLFFLDYIAIGTTDPAKVEQIVAGVSEGCRQAGCALVGGETAEMPSMYEKGDFDLAGFAVGIAEADEIDRSKFVKTGDVLVALPSSGLHSNGFSLARKVVSELGLKFDEKVGDKKLIDVLLEPTRIYVSDFLRLKDKITAMAHITGGGIVENLPRVFPAELGAKVQKSAIKTPEIFKIIAQKVEESEMMRTFNMGVGMILVVPKENVNAVLASSDGYVIGEVVNGKGVELI